MVPMTTPLIGLPSTIPAMSPRTISALSKKPPALGSGLAMRGPWQSNPPCASFVHAGLVNGAFTLLLREG